MPLKQTAFRLNERDLQIIDDVKERARLTTRTEALRYLLRMWVNNGDFTEKYGVPIAKKIKGRRK